MYSVDLIIGLKEICYRQLDISIQLTTFILYTIDMNKASENFNLNKVLKQGYKVLEHINQHVAASNILIKNLINQTDSLKSLSIHNKCKYIEIIHNLCYALEQLSALSYAVMNILKNIQRIVELSENNKVDVSREMSLEKKLLNDKVCKQTYAIRACVTFMKAFFLCIEEFSKIVPIR